MSTREIVSRTVAMVGVLAFAATTTADVTSSNSSVTIFGQDLAAFTTEDNYVFDGQATIVQKKFKDLDPIRTEISWERGDLDMLGPPAGFRWFERIYNYTDVAWTDYVFEISDNKDAFLFQDGAFGSGNPGPSQALSDLDPLGHVSKITLTGAQPKISNDDLSLWFAFDEPIQPGSYLDILVPILGLSNEGGTFVLTQMPVVIPAPPAVLLGCLGLGLVVCVRRRFG